MTAARGLDLIRSLQGPRSAGSPGACSTNPMLATHGIGTEPEG